VWKHEQSGKNGRAADGHETGGRAADEYRSMSADTTGARQTKSPARLQIYDTTLRDGMQGMNIAFSLEDKLEIVRALDEFAIDYIEGGFPQSNQKEMQFFKECQSIAFRHAKLAAFGPTCRNNAVAERDLNLRALLEAETAVVTIVGKTWKAHVTDVLKTDYEENRRMISDSVRFLKSEQREVILDMEHFFDGYKDDSAYALSLLQSATDAGVDLLVLCDTNGGTLPSEIASIYDALPQSLLAPLGGHFHNDCGTGVANSVAAIEHGAIQIQGTINGWGERTGNANLCVIIPNAIIKKGCQTACAANLHKLTHISRFVAEKANIIPAIRQPFVGDTAFSHKAGQHADVIAKAPHLMEHIDAATVGNKRNILVSELAGKATVVLKLKKFGDFDKHTKEVEELTALLKEREQMGFEYEAAEASFELLIYRVLKRYRALATLVEWHVEQQKDADVHSSSRAKIVMRVNNKERTGRASGVGPVETIDAALRDAMVSEYQFLTKVHLIDYRVRVLTPEEATAAKVRVFIASSDGENRWETVGVHQNIIEASWQALFDSYDYYYNNFVLNNGVARS